MYFGCTPMAPHGGPCPGRSHMQNMMQYPLSIAKHDCLRSDVRAAETVCGCANSLIHLPAGWSARSPASFISIVIKTVIIKTYNCHQFVLFCSSQQIKQRFYRNRAETLRKLCTTVANPLSPRPIDERVLRLAAASPTGAGATFPAPVYMPNGRSVYQKENRQQSQLPVIGLRRRNKSPRIPLIWRFRCAAVRTKN